DTLIACDSLAQAMGDMITKEEKILFPVAMEHLTTSEWVEARRGEAEIGYAYIDPPAAWPGTGGERTLVSLDRVEGMSASAPRPELLHLNTGALTAEQISLLLDALKIDLNFVDENDEVRFYSDGERLFPRSPGVIGRKVQNCHPASSVHKVQQIIDAFRAGTQDVADFWIQLHGKFIHIRYLAMRDADGNYRGTLETVQDVTDIRELTGERRLVDW
ncbi:MAG: PAS domain-containing protein, partial [Propioniciclava sp.]